MNKRMRLTIVFGILMLLNSHCVRKVGNDNPKNKMVERQDTTVSQIMLWDAITIKDLVYLLGKSIDSLPKFEKYSKEKIIIEDNEESVPNWFGVKYLHKNNLIFIAESDWMNKNIVSRITLYSNEIREGKLYVGQTFGDVKNLTKEKDSTSSDGELSVILNKYPEISIHLDISNIPDTSPLYYGGVTISEIPDSLKIVSIVVMKRQ